MEGQQTSKADSRALIHFGHLLGPRGRRADTGPIPPGESVVVGFAMTGIMRAARYQANLQADLAVEASSSCKRSLDARGLANSGVLAEQALT